MSSVAEAYHWIDHGPGAVSVESVPGRPTAFDDDTLEGAVYAHIQALRGLGKTEANSAEIARALGLRLLDVDRAIRKLKDVRVIAA